MIRLGLEYLDTPALSVSEQIALDREIMSEAGRGETFCH